MPQLWADAALQRENTKSNHINTIEEAEPSIAAEHTLDLGDDRGGDGESVPVSATRRWRARTSKRLLDMTVAAIALLVVAPVIAVLALLVRIESPGAAIFRQIRVGKDGKRFVCFKLRTMFVDAEQRLQTLLHNDRQAQQEFHSSRKLKSDPRTTTIGRFLRTTSLDELPQLWNVVRGEMSLVGPRPLPLGDVGHYGDEIDVVLQVRPGLTGIWQVSGRSDLSFADRVALDSSYAVNRTFWNDMLIILRTIPVLILRKGAY